MSFNLDGLTEVFYSKIIDKLAPAVESKTNIRFKDIPEVIVGEIVEIDAYVKRSLSKRNELSGKQKTPDEFKADVREARKRFLLESTAKYDPLYNVIIINNPRKNIPDAADITGMLTTALQHQEAGDLILPYSLGLVGSFDEIIAKDISLKGQGIYVAHQIMSDNEYKGLGGEKGYKRTSKIISLPIKEMINREDFTRKLKKANKIVGNPSNMGYRDLIKTEVDYKTLVGELQELLPPYQKLIGELQGLIPLEKPGELPPGGLQKVRQAKKLEDVFNTLREILLIDRVGYQFNRDLAKAGIPAQTIMKKIPSSLSEINIEFYKK